MIGHSITSFDSSSQPHLIEQGLVVVVVVVVVVSSGQTHSICMSDYTLTQLSDQLLSVPFLNYLKKR